MCQQAQMPDIIQKQGPGMGPKLELFMSNSKCFHRLSEEQEYQAELMCITPNKIMQSLTENKYDFKGYLNGEAPKENAVLLLHFSSPDLQAQDTGQKHNYFDFA